MKTLGILSLESTNSCCQAPVFGVSAPGAPAPEVAFGLRGFGGRVGLVGSDGVVVLGVKRMDVSRCLLIALAG